MITVLKSVVIIIKASENRFLTSINRLTLHLVFMMAWFSKKGGDDLVTGEVPIIDTNNPEETKTATFSMGCFWGPDALFGSKDGVVRTRVGYAGGTKQDPTYRSLGDHTETTQIDYDPNKITYSELLDIFWSNHDPTTRRTTQYMTMIFYHDEEQKKLVMESKEQMQERLSREVNTLIVEYDKFYLAEDYHQKYQLSRNSRLYSAFKSIYPDMKDFVDSTAVARANGLVSGKGDISIVDKLGLNEEGKELIRKTYKRAGGG
ncbi:MAG: peptide-methionine (S)-S-oxide reductase MsrA [Candidatus Saliniplasma sp.]